MYKTCNLFSFLLVLLLLGCSNGKKKKLEDNNSHNSRLFLKMSINDDSLNQNILKGTIIYYYKIDDTLKVQNKDSRNVYLALNIEPDDSNESKIKEDVFFEKELNFSAIEINDTIHIPFKVKTSLKGKITVYGGINDNVILNSYTTDKEKVRVITYEQTFKESFFLK